MPTILQITHLERFTPEEGVRNVARFIAGMLEAGEVRRLPDDSKMRLRLASFALEELAGRIPPPARVQQRSLFSPFFEVAARMLK